MASWHMAVWHPICCSNHDLQALGILCCRVENILCYIRWIYSWLIWVSWWLELRLGQMSECGVNCRVAPILVSVNQACNDLPWYSYCPAAFGEKASDQSRMWNTRKHFRYSSWAPKFVSMFVSISGSYLASRQMIPVVHNTPQNML